MSTSTPYRRHSIDTRNIVARTSTEFYVRLAPVRPRELSSRLRIDHRHPYIRTYRPVFQHSWHLRTLQEVSLLAIHSSIDSKWETFVLFFSGKNYWSKDLIFLVTEEEHLGMFAFLEAYFNEQKNPQQNYYLNYGYLPARAGNLQAAVNLEIQDIDIGWCFPSTPIQLSLHLVIFCFVKFVLCTVGHHCRLY